MLYATFVERPLQITPFFAKRTQFFPDSASKKRISLKNEPKTNPNEPKTNPNEPKTKPILAQKHRCVEKRTQFLALKLRSDQMLWQKSLRDIKRGQKRNTQYARRNTSIYCAATFSFFLGFSSLTLTPSNFRCSSSSTSILMRFLPLNSPRSVPSLSGSSI